MDNEREAGKAAKKAWNESEAGKEARKAWNKSDAGKAANKAWYKTEAGQAAKQRENAANRAKTLDKYLNRQIVALDSEGRPLSVAYDKCKRPNTA